MFQLSYLVYSQIWLNLLRKGSPLQLHHLLLLLLLLKFKTLVQIGTGAISLMFWNFCVLAST
jgi:hypothetical protein